MGKVYVGQSLRINVEMGADITGGTCLVKYKKPGFVTGSWPATISDGPTGAMFVDVTPDTKGHWTMWGHATVGSNVLIGESKEVHVFEEGE